MLPPTIQTTTAGSIEEIPPQSDSSPLFNAIFISPELATTPPSSVTDHHLLRRTPLILLLSQNQTTIAPAWLGGNIQGVLPWPSDKNILHTLLKRILPTTATLFNPLVNLLLQQSSDGLWVLDKQLVTQAINPMACTLFGKQADEIIGKIYTHVFSNLTGDTQKLTNYFEDCSAQPTVIHFSHEITLNRADEQIITIEGAIHPIHIQTQFQGLLVIIRPASPLEKTEQLQNNFIAMASHNLRNPLMSIQSALDYVLEVQADQTKQRYLLEQARHQTQKIAAFLQEILNICSLPNSQIPLRIQPINFLPLLNAIITELETLTTDLTIDLHVSNILPLIWVDELKVELILRNLLTHSKYRLDTQPPTHPKTIDIRVSQNETHLITTITDNGPLINPTRYEQIFLPVYTLEPDKDIDMMPYAYIIGLFTTRRLIKLLNGKIWLTEQNQTQTAFNMALPLWKP